ncbi:DUF3137 domain-containing protein [Erysipelothrix urinaevulpis]|uniref:DUF3137 domain-containing protein n=1 Tax=Erysipelothrix urinaevulpis TaxID=2683717 RepID=UPI00135CEED1|nr:DUF3137 domain-containing protein [Erysipelothrix urinaevulpis]
MFLLIIIVFLGLVLWLHIHQKKKAKRYKEEVVQRVIGEMFTDYEYHHEGMSESRIFETKLVSRGNIFSSSDYLRANYHGINFEFSDVLVQNRIQTGKTSTTVTYFKGQWLVVKPRIPIKGRLFIIDKQLRTNPQGFLFKDYNLNKMEFESIQFNKEFKVYSEDDLEAFRVVDPKKIMKMLDYKDFDISLFQNEHELHIAIYSDKDILEPTLFEEFSYEKDCKLVKQSIEEVLKYLEVFEIEKDVIE